MPFLLSTPSDIATAHRMTSSETSALTFSPLESLFLCQSVAQYGVANTSFEKISEELRKSSTSAANNDDRLGAESLKTFFLRLLKTEAKTHLQHALVDGNADGGHDGATKKASSSPRLMKIEDANAHVQLLPQLVDKLYVSYKDEALREIRAEEQRYNELISRRSEMQVQGAGINQGAVTSNGGADVGTAQQNGNILSPVQQRVFTQDTSAARRPSADPRDGRSSSRPRTSELKIDAILNPETPMTRSPQQGPSGSPARYSTQAGTSTPHDSRPQPPPVSASSHQSALPSHTTLHQSLHEPVRPNLGGSPTLFSGQSSYNTPILPSVPGMTAGSPLPVTHWSPSGSPSMNRPIQSMQSRQLPSPVDPIRRPSLPPTAPSPPITKPQPPTSLYQQSAQYAARPPPFQQQSFYQQPPGRGGVMLPPFQVQPQAQMSPIQQQPHRQIATPVARITAPVQQYAASEPRPLAHRAVSDLRTSVGPVSQTPPARSARPQAPQPDYTYTPGSTTGWRLPSNVRLPPVILRAPSMSPERDIVPTTTEASRTSQAKLTGSTRKPGSKKAEEKGTASSAKPSTKKGKGARAISNTPSAAATSTFRGRTRSQSIISQQEDPLVRDHVKTEYNLPAGDFNDNSEVNETPTRPNGDRGRTRTVATSSAALAASKKRKREQTFSIEHTDNEIIPSSTAETDAAPLETDTMEPHNNTVLAYRNFHKMTAPIMNNITSHKHASIFANPVKDKSAEGYSDIIKRPQDLKSIRAAIMAGSRAVAAATASLSTDSPAGSGTPNGTSTPNASGSTGGLVELPWSIDLVPPRGIVNGAQLEQEVMRMFANAVMFNPGNEGVVEDAREMFENVEVAVQAWRATQKEVSASNASASAEKTKAKRAEEEDAKNGRDDSLDELADAEMVDVSSISGTSASRRKR